LEAIIALPNDLFYNTGIATYIWVLTNKKANHRKGKVQLINANEMYEKRRKSLGNKRNDIPTHYMNEITQIFGDFKETEISKIFDNEEFGYSKIVVERKDKSLKDTENVPLSEDIDSYFAREVLPFAPDAWIDKNKTKIGYEIPFTRYFYKHTPPQPADEIMQEILEIEKELDGALKRVFE